jgi:hypothetical protein
MHDVSDPGRVRLCGMMDTFGVPGEETETPYTDELVRRVVDQILRGDLRPVQLGELVRAIEQAKRGATGPLPVR